MRITDVKSYVIEGRTVFVQVFTDENIIGIGECSPMNCEVLAHFVETALKPLLIDENPLEIDRLWHKMFFRTYKLGVQGAQPEAIAGVDIALWDILGKVTSLPIHTLLGGKYRDKVQMYASIGGGGAIQPQAMVERVAAFYERGIRAFKIRMDWGAYRMDADPEKDWAMFQAVRDYLGDEIPLSFDANNGYSVPMAIKQGRRFESLGIRHFEEPVAQYDYTGLAQVAVALDVPISAGEHEYTRWQFRDLILQAQVDILQPDLVKSGGITESKKIAVLVETHNKIFLPHQTQSTVGTAANLHLIAALQWADWPQEYAGPRPYLDPIVVAGLDWEDGWLRIPDGPGLGLTIDQDALAPWAWRP